MCVVCNQPWPEGEYRYGQEQLHRQGAACGAHSGVDEAVRDIEHLLFAALRVLSDDTEDGTTEKHRRGVVSLR